ncbi:hypothetical protein JOS77_23475 [Chromobacterium haemolyticum]|nr:hypothetical protein JOS77_23475 [Chromobacterium haemolyticum]
MQRIRTWLCLAALGGGLSLPALAADVVRLGNLKFAHYGAISYMKEIAPKYDLKIEERMFAKGIDIMPAIVAGEVDVAASAADAAVAGRAAARLSSRWPASPRAARASWRPKTAASRASRT